MEKAQLDMIRKVDATDQARTNWDGWSVAALTAVTNRHDLLAYIEELEAKVNRCAELADKWEHGALRWADPLPVPPEVELIREAIGVSS